MGSLQALLTDTFSLRRAFVVDAPQYATDFLPLIYGDLTGGKGGLSYCPGIVEATNTYLIADHRIQSAANGNAPTFYADGVVVSPASWTEATTVAGRTAATVTFSTSYAGMRVGYRGRGRASDAGALIENPISMVEDFLTTFVGVDAQDFDRTALESSRALAAALGYKCAGVLDLDRSPATTISEVLACFAGYYFINPAGRIVLVLDDGRVPSLSGTADHIRSSEFEGAEASWSRPEVVNRVAVSFTRNAYDNGLQQKYQDFDDGEDTRDATSIAVHGEAGPGSTESALEFPWARDANSVRTAQRIIVSRLATPRARIRVGVPGWRIAHLDVGDHVGFSWDRLFDGEGRRLKNQVGLIEEIGIDLDALKVDVTLRDTGAWIARAYPADGTSRAGWTGTSGTVTLANTRLSLAAANAFVDLTGVDLSPYAGGGARITLTDSAGKKLVGWIWAAGSGVTYGAELLANGSFATDPVEWTGINATLARVAGGESGDCLQITRTAGAYVQAQSAIGGQAEGQPYRARVYVKSGSAGAAAAYVGFTLSQGGALSQITTSTASWQLFEYIGVPPVGNTLLAMVLHGAIASGTMLFDTASLKQILTPSATGATIYSLRGGGSPAWASEDVGFNRNDTSGYTWTIDSVPQVQAGAGRDLRDY
jgi:hypothetical protein